MTNFYTNDTCPICETKRKLIYFDIGGFYNVVCTKCRNEWCETDYRDEKDMYLAMREEEEMDEETIEDTLEERGKTYGHWKKQAEITHMVKRGMNFFGDVDELPVYQAQALCMIASKIARIVNGDSNYIDSWRDIEGYARLVRNELEQKQ